MDSLQTFDQFLSSSGADLSIWKYVINILLTALLSYLLGSLYDRFGNSLSNRNNFRKNFVVLAVTTMIIITIVKSSLALSLGLVGALSIVRFRTAIKEPEELAYLFLNITIGLGFGADQRIVTIVGFVLISTFILSRSFFQRSANYDNQSLVLTLSTDKPVDDQINSIIDILKDHCKRVNLKRFDENNQVLEASFIIEINDFKDFNDIKNGLRKEFKDLTVSFIDNSMTI